MNHNPIAPSIQSHHSVLQTKGMMAMLMAMLVYTSINAFLKTSEQTYAPTQLVFLRNIFSLIPYIILIIANHEWSSLKIPNYGTHFVRALLGVISLGCLFKSIMLLPLADAITISYASCLFVVVLAIPLLHEHVSAKGWFAVGMGFLGVLIVAQPTGDLVNFGAISGIISAFLEAFLMVQGRKLTRINSNTAIVFYYGLFAAFISGITMPFYWIPPTPHDWTVLITLGIGGGIGQYLITMAYRHAPAGVLSPLIYSSLLWSMTFGYFLFNEIPSFNLFWGAPLIIAAGFLVVMKR